MLFQPEPCAHTRFELAGASLTVKQAAYLLLDLKRQHKQRDTHFDMLVRLLSVAILPPGNLLPPSLHLIEKVLDVKAIHSYAYHVCPNDHHSWPLTPPADWEAHRNDRV